MYFLDAVVERFFVRAHRHAHDLRPAGRHGLLQDATLAVFAQQIAGVAVDRPAEGGMPPRHLDHVRSGFRSKQLQECIALAVPAR